ncbi:MAG: hypothetical protein H0U67_12280 [Gemmatimonadetes bacterium]|nr:hypothetical protein [Gemmatimonadota bacterium]
MRVNARERTGWRLARMMMIAGQVLLSGCRPEVPGLQIAEVISIPAAEATTLHVDRDGRLWLGEETAVSVLDGGEVVARTAIAPGDAPRVVGETDSSLLMRRGTTAILMFDPASGELLAETAITGEPLLDVRGRWVFVAAGSGAVLMHEPDSLVLISAWASLGMASTALAASPEGDRIYHALSDDDGAASILTRDLQTGRTLRTSVFSAPFVHLATDRQGNLVGVVGGEDDAAVISLRPWGQELELRWRARISSSAMATRIHLSPDGGRAAVLTPGDTKTGLLLLDGETGRSIGQLPEHPLDARFDSSGRLLLLFPSEIRVVR